MVINNRIHSKNIADKIFWYKAKEPPKFKIGSEKFIKYHKNSYDKEWNNRLAVFDPNTAVTKRNSIRLIVDKVK
jgi:hypothetical protein